MNQTVFNELEISLNNVKKTIDREIKSGDRLINGSLDYVKETSGKLLRPRFVLIGAGFGTPKNIDDIERLAATIELLHSATLVHDDVIDDAKLRRGMPSVQSKYSKEYAIYMGDFLFSRCFMMLSELNIDAAIAKRLAGTINRICKGEMKQHFMRYDTTITVYTYLKIITRKTAALFALSLSSGAKYAEADDAICKLLGRIGLNVGMAFQIMDDILDFEGDEAIIGKEVQADIIRGYYSLPVIYALKTDKGKTIQELIGQEDIQIEKVMALVKESQALAASKELAIKYSNKAIKLMKQLPNCQGKVILETMIPELLNRIY